jgi:hypothetical protein
MAVTSMADVDAEIGRVIADGEAFLNRLAALVASWQTWPVEPTSKEQVALAGQAAVQIIPNVQAALAITRRADADLWAKLVDNRRQNAAMWTSG